MNIDTFYPENSILKEHIEYYYFQKTTSDDFSAEYYAFPNTLQALNIHKNISCKIKGHSVAVRGIRENNFMMILQGRFELPLHVHQTGKINKVTIIFKPLGLNHFIKNPFDKIAGEPSQIFTEWTNDKITGMFLKSFYSETNSRKRIESLENYLLLKYTFFEHAAILKQALNMLSDFDKEPSIEEIANTLFLNVRTFNRLFCKHLGVTPVGYRKIARFRHSLKSKLFDTRFTTLTKIGYESNFYDQSYFIKMYKQVTGENPSRFFNTIDKLADKQLIFKFIHK